jgi:hypothetical protein
VEKTLIAIGFFAAGFAILGVAGILFALGNRKEDQDEGKEADTLDEDWVNEVLEDLDEPAEPSAVGDVSNSADEGQADDLDEFWKSVMEVDDLDEPEDWYEAPEQEEPHDDQQEDSQAEQQEDEQVEQQEGPREEPRDDGQEEGQDVGQEESHDGQQEVEQDAEQEEGQDGERDGQQDADKTESETERTVFATANGKTWHTEKECPRLRRSKNVNEMTLSEATVAGMKPCGVCGK